MSRWRDSGQQMLAHNLEQGEWAVRGGEVSVKVAMSQVLIDVAMGDGPKSTVHARARKSGRQAAEVQNGEWWSAIHAADCRCARQRSGTAPARAAGQWRTRWCSTCRRNFGAEIRTVIDLKERS